MGWTSLIDTKVSDTPQLAPEDYRLLPPFILNREDKYGEGSGVPLKEVPCYTEAWQEKYTDECGACKSTHTQCIYADYFADMAGKDDNYELECLDCGKYTVYQYLD